MRIGFNSPRDVLGLVVRRKWWVMGVFVALTCTITLLTWILPKTFVSEALVVVRPRDVPADFVKDLIADSTEQRLRSIQQEVLSRTNLIQILQEFGDKMIQFRDLNMDEKVEKLRAQIGINFELEKLEKRRDGAIPVTYFRISYQNPSPELAQKIATKLTSLFIEHDNRARESQVFGTTEFLSSELSKVAALLGTSEEKLKVVKTSRQFELPTQVDANLRTLDRLGQEKKTNSEALDRFAALKIAIEGQLAQTPETVTVYPQAQAAAGRPGPVPLDPNVEEYKKARLYYEEASARYTPLHPEVQMAKARVDRLEKQIPPDVLAALNSSAGDNRDSEQAGTRPDQSKTVPNPIYQKLAGQLVELKTELGIREREKALIDSEMRKFSSRVENAPKAEQDISDVQRENDDLKKQYTELKNKLSQASLAESLESKQKGEQFIIVDPPNLPLTPTKPNKPVIVIAGAALSLLLSVGLALGVDVMRQRIWMASQIEAIWGVPVLVDIPEIITDSEQQAMRKKKAIYLASSAAGALAYSFGLYLIYSKSAFVLQLLDPVLQKTLYK